MVDRALVAARMASARAHMVRVRKFLPAAAEALERDADLQDLVAHNVWLAVQDCIDLAAHTVSDKGWGVAGSFAEGFELLHEHAVLAEGTSDAMIKAAGLRNRIVHRYGDLDWKIVHAAVAELQQAVESFLRELAQFLGN